MYQSEKCSLDLSNSNMLPSNSTGPSREALEALVHAVDLDPMVLDAASSVGAMPPAIQGLQASLDDFEVEAFWDIFFGICWVFNRLTAPSHASEAMWSNHCWFLSGLVGGVVPYYVLLSPDLAPVVL